MSNVSFASLMAETSSAFGVSAKGIYDFSRLRDVAHARHAVVLLARNRAGLSLSKIGEHLRGRHHSTILNSERRALELRSTNPEWAAKYEAANKRLERKGEAA